MFGFFKYILLVSAIFIWILAYFINLSTPPQLSQQINVKTMSAIKLHSYTKNYSSDREPNGTGWWRGTYWGK